MGRVSKYKKIKACDITTRGKNGAAGGTNAGFASGWGYGNDGRKAKKKSLTAIHHQKRKAMEKSKRKQQQEPHGGQGHKERHFNAAPPEEDEFDLADLNTVKQHKRQRLDHGLITVAPTAITPTSDTAAAAAAIDTPPIDTTPGDDGNGVSASKWNNATNDEALREARFLKVVSRENTQQLMKQQSAQAPGGKGNNNKVAPIKGRMEGESMRAFERRLREETRLILRQEVKEGAGSRNNANPEKYAKKKEFLKNKKAKKKAPKRSSRDMDSDDDEDDNHNYNANSGSTGGSDGFMTGERAVAAAAAASRSPAFGEQAERPPVFTLLPRGARALEKARQAKTMMNKKNVAANDNGTKESKIEAEQRSMEAMRNKVQAQYELIKARRKEAGDFHL
jgi:hypothetical protein